MNRDSVIMILVFVAILIAVVGLLTVRNVINYCKTEGNTTDVRSICFKPSDFCEMKCTEFDDNFTGEITVSTCVCDNGVVAHDPDMKHIREYWNDSMLLNF